MPIVQLRGLAQRGIIKDQSPYDLDDSAWSGGNNVMFLSTNAQRTPVFRTVKESLTSPPAFVVGQQASTGFDRVVMVGNTGRIWSWFSGTYAEVTPAAHFTAGTIAGTITADFLGDVLYVNNPSQGLYFVGPAGGAFAIDPAWDLTWTAAVFRVYKDYPIALNVTKGAQTNPSLVKWGDNTLAGLTTLSWDSTDPTKNAGETPIADLTGPILDGRVMRSIFVIYSQDQIWEMAESGDIDVFHFRRLFTEGGIIGTNCVVEVNGEHYVFGPYDIYAHDGVTKRSLVDKRNREWVFQHLNKKQANRCFVQHIPALHSILFCYVSSDEDVAFPVPSVGCNKALVYNYVDDAIGFADLPNVTAMSLANLNSILTWAAPTTITWDNTGGSWADQTDGYGRVPVAVSCTMTGVSSDRLLGYDFIDKGDLAFSAVTELNPPSFLERTGLDLDSVQAGLATYKTVQRVYPQMRALRAVPMTIQVGASMTSGGTISWSATIPYDPATQYKVDVQKGGRYLAYRFSTSVAPADFEVTGFDVQVTSGGKK